MFMHVLRLFYSGLFILLFCYALTDMGVNCLMSYLMDERMPGVHIESSLFSLPPLYSPILLRRPPICYGDTDFRDLS